MPPTKTIKTVRGIFHGKAVAMEVEVETKYEYTCSFNYPYTHVPALHGQWSVLISKQFVKPTDTKDIFVVGGDVGTSAHYSATKTSDRLKKATKPQTKLVKPKK